MSENDPVTVERVADLVMANRAIRAPYYEKDSDDGLEFTDPDKGLQWGADVIPALLGLFRVEPDPREDTEGWVGFARHWRGSTLRVDFTLYSSDESAPILVANAMYGRKGSKTVDDEQFGEIELPDATPTREEWENREKAYQAARRTDDSDGTAAVNAFIEAMPADKREIARRFDDIVQSEVPEVRRAIRWHQPFYGVEGRGWFASIGALSKYVKLTFVCGSDMEPRPPSGTGPDRQAIDVAEADDLDEDQVASWVRQAADDPGMNW